MSGKKYPGKFTVQFNMMDPAHQQVIAKLEAMGRTKAQFLANAVLHYMHCTQTPDTSQPTPTDYAAIEVIVRKILSEQDAHNEKPPKNTGHPRVQNKKLRKSEEICFEDAVDLLGKDSIAAITETLSALRQK